MSPDLKDDELRPDSKNVKTFMALQRENDQLRADIKSLRANTQNLEAKFEAQTQQMFQKAAEMQAEIEALRKIARTQDCICQVITTAPSLPVHGSHSSTHSNRYRADTKLESMRSGFHHNPSLTSPTPADCPKSVKTGESGFVPVTLEPFNLERTTLRASPSAAVSNHIRVQKRKSSDRQGDPILAITEDDEDGEDDDSLLKCESANESLFTPKPAIPKQSRLDSLMTTPACHSQNSSLGSNGLLSMKRPRSNPVRAPSKTVVEIKNEKSDVLEEIEGKSPIGLPGPIETGAQTRRLHRFKAHSASSRPDKDRQDNGRHPKANSPPDSLYGKPADTVDNELLKRYLGPGSEERIRQLTTAARNNLLHDAKTKLMADDAGNRRDVRRTRRPSPTGFWRTDMTESQ